MNLSPLGVSPFFCDNVGLVSNHMHLLMFETRSRLHNIDNFALCREGSFLSEVPMNVYGHALVVAFLAITLCTCCCKESHVASLGALSQHLMHSIHACNSQLNLY